MKVLLASSEVHPYSKTGGLGDTVGALAKSLARAGHEVGVVTPLYSGIKERFPGVRQLDLHLDLALGRQRVRSEVWSFEWLPGLTVYFIDQSGFYRRPGLYQENGSDYPDNAERFIFLSQAVAHLAMQLPWRPEVLHVNDWHVGLAPLLVQHQQRLSGQRNGLVSCLTIHNLAYQGLFPAAKYELTNLPSDYFTPAAVEFYGQMGCLKAGIARADVLTTVSPRYAREITTREFGCGLDGLLRERRDFLAGILNGVDYEEWDPANDSYISVPYSPEQLAGKEANKLELQREFGLPVNAGVPVFGNIGRQVEQKGIDILLMALEAMLPSGFQFVLLGTGQPAFERAWQNLARRFPAQLGVKIGFDQRLAHRIEAGCDFFVMPSRFEPCGLNQMYGLRYGTIPIVRAVGGLDDTVIDARQDAEKADGIKFQEPSPAALAKAIGEAIGLFKEPDLLGRYRSNAMSADFSWDRVAAQYVGIYERAKGKG